MGPIIWLAVAVSAAVPRASGPSAVSAHALIAIGIVVLYAWVMLSLWRAGRLK